MQRNMEQHEAEESWQHVPSSAGHTTQHISRPTFVPNRRNQLVALGLLAIGLLMLFGQIVGGGSGPVLPPVAPEPMLAPIPSLSGGMNFMPGMILLTIASGFLFFAFWRRNFGLSIPGCLLVGLSLGVTYVDLTNGVSILWGLALGFLGIELVARLLFNLRLQWPVIPAVIMFCVGLIVAIAQLPAFFPLGNTLLMFPLLLIAAGLYLGWGRRAH